MTRGGVAQDSVSPTTSLRRALACGGRAWYKCLGVGTPVWGGRKTHIYQCVGAAVHEYGGDFDSTKLIAMVGSLHTI